MLNARVVAKAKWLKSPMKKISDLSGLGKEIWHGTDAVKYQRKLREEWDMKLQKTETNNVPVNISMSMELLQKIDTEAQKAGISRSDAIRQMVQWYLNSIESVKPAK